jgi:hypothetical protein
VQIEVEAVTPLRFPDGSPVRAASAVARLGDGQLIAQDDATHAAWLRDDGTVTAVRLLPPVEGLDVFEEASGTKHLKPDLEAACQVNADGTPAVLLLGSGSSQLRMRSSLVRLDGGEAWTVVTDLAPLYGSVVDALGIEHDQLNMEGACVVGSSLRWFFRGMPSAGLPTASVDLDLERLLAAVTQGADASTVPVSAARHYDLGDVQGVGLAVTDAVVLREGAILVSAAAEDAANAREDGPVVGSALALLSDDDVTDMAVLPDVDGEVPKVEGLSILEHNDSGVRVLATVDADDPEVCSMAVHLRVRW